MPGFFYAVTATLPSEKLAGEYCSWLQEGHIEAVIEGGATSGRIVRLDGDEICIQTQYDFVDRAAFDRYVQRTAPALREDGLSRFPPDRGVAFERQLGVIL